MDDDTLGSRIKRLRAFFGLRQIRLARKIGKSGAWLSLVENDNLDPTDTDVVRIADALGVDVQLLRPKPRRVVRQPLPHL